MVTVILQLWLSENTELGYDSQELAGLVLVALPVLHVARVEADLLVVLLQGGHVLPGLRELTLLHALAHVPVHEGALGVHQVELVVQPAETW